MATKEMSRIPGIIELQWSGRANDPDEWEEREQEQESVDWVVDLASRRIVRRSLLGLEPRDGRR